MSVIPAQRTAEQVTPTGVLVYDGPAKTDGWYAARRQGITATDLPSILGMSRYDNALSVWHDKRGELPDQANRAARWGNVLEEPIAQAWAEDHGVTVRRVGVLANVDQPWVRASLDRLPDRCPDGDGPCGLEVKSRSAFFGGQWRDDVPDDVLGQVTWQMVTAGYQHIHVACLVGGNDERWLRVDWDDTLAAFLVDKARPVWQHVLDQTPPPVADSAILVRLLEALHRDRAGEIEISEKGLRDLVAEYNAGCALERAAEEAKEAGKAKILRYLADAEDLTVDGKRQASMRRSKDGESFDKRAWERLCKNDPDAADLVREFGLMAPRKGSRTFYLSKTYRSTGETNDE